MLWRRKRDATQENALAKPADRVPEAETAGELNIKRQPQPDRPRGAPKSPRAALQPERVPMPTRRSERARHPMVVAGNFLFTALIALFIVIGGGLWVIKSKLGSPGPLQDDKVVNMARAGAPDVADALEREGVINQRWPFIVAVWLNKVRGSDVKAGEYQFAKHASLQDVINTLTDGKVDPTRDHDSRRSHVGADRPAPARYGFSRRQHQVDPARRIVASRDLPVRALDAARTGDPTHAKRSARHRAEGLGAAQP